MQCSIRDVTQMQSANTYDVTEREITLISTLWRVPKKYIDDVRVLDRVRGMFDIQPTQALLDIIQMFTAK